MSELIKKWAVVDMLTALENDFQQYKPFQGNEEAMYRKVCEVEMAIGKMDPFMEKIVDVNVCENMLDQALIENANMAEKIEMQEELIAKQEAEFEIQKRTLSELKDDLAWANEEISRLEHDIEILKAKMDVVRMIFGGWNDA